MAAQDFQRGAQMAMQAAGIADQMQQRMFMNKLHEAQMNQILVKQQQEQGLANTAQQWQQEQILPGEFTGTQPMATQTPESLYGLAGKLMGKPEGLGPGVNILNSATNMEKAGGAETPAQRLMREIMVAQVRGGGKTPNQLALVQQSLDPSNPEAQAQAKAALDEVNRRQIQVNKASGIGRAEGFGAIRPAGYIDTYNNNKVVTLNPNDLNAEPDKGRYLPLAGSQAPLNKTALIEDIRGAINNTRKSLANMPEFTAGQAAQIAIVMKQRDPRSALSAFFASQIGQTLTPEQQDYLTDLNQLIENGMAMRSVLGAGQGSDELRAAITSTIPSAKTPNKAYASMQLDKFEGQINRLERGVPKVPLRPEQPVGPTSGGRFRDNGKIYNIPPDKISAFMADHPNAEQVK